jgi:hypothetical protein
MRFFFSPEVPKTHLHVKKAVLLSAYLLPLTIGLCLTACSNQLSTESEKGNITMRQERSSISSLEKTKYNSDDIQLPIGVIQNIPLTDKQLHDFRLKPITASSLPKGLIVKKFETMEEAKKYIAESLQSLSFQAEGSIVERSEGYVLSMTDGRGDVFSPSITGGGRSSEYGRGMGSVNIPIGNGLLSTVYFSLNAWHGDDDSFSATDWNSPTSIYTLGMPIGWSIQNSHVSADGPTLFGSGIFTFHITLTIPMGMQIGSVLLGEVVRVEWDVVYNARGNRCRIFSRIRWDHNI